MLFDFILVAVIGTLILICLHRGAVKATASVIVAAVTCLTATIIGQLLSNLCYNRFVEPAIEKAVSNALDSVKTRVASSIASSLPSWITGFLDTAGVDTAKLLTEPVGSTKDVLSEAIDTAVHPVINALLTFMITLFLFFVVLSLTRRYMLKPLSERISFSFTEKNERIFCAVIGFIDALLLLCMFAYLSKLMLGNIGSKSSWLNEEKINNSFMFRLLYSGNIFSWIGSLLTA